MKTLLLNLPKNLDNRFDYDQVAQPLGLACISSFMKKQDLYTSENIPTWVKPPTYGPENKKKREASLTMSLFTD